MGLGRLLELTLSQDDSSPASLAWQARLQRHLVATRSACSPIEKWKWYRVLPQLRLLGGILPVSAPRRKLAASFILVVVDSFPKEGKLKLDHVGHIN